MNIKLMLPHMEVRQRSQSEAQARQTTKGSAFLKDRVQMFN